MMQLRQDYSLFQNQDTIIVAVGPEKRDVFAKFWQENKMPFIGISDSEHKIADLYRQQVNILKLGRMPAQMLIDKKGILRYLHYGRSMKDIPANQEILDLINVIQNEE